MLLLEIARSHLKMSDPSENEIIQQSKEEYVPEIDTTNYFQLQDEKFEELHRKLHKLKGKLLLT